MAFFLHLIMSTKKITGYRNLLNVTKTVTLKELKTIYRNSMKEFHPDKFPTAEEQAEAEVKSKEIIEAYHFLVSIANETVEKNREEFEAIIQSNNIAEFYMDEGILFINLIDGSKFEYYGVPKVTYIKMVNAESPARFAKRHIYGQFVYRSAQKMSGLED